METIKIKNMVCGRCISTVRDILEDMGYEVRFVELGQAAVEGQVDDAEERNNIDRALQQSGFMLIRNKSDELAEEIKAQLIRYLEHIEDEENPRKVSEYLSDRLHHNYSYLSSHFSTETGSTVEQYLIQLKIERVKELLTYRELTLSEIAWKLNYSSVQYLSNQFKKVTGETVSSFRKHLDNAGRQPLDAV